MENPIKMDDLGVPLFLETPTWQITDSLPLRFPIFFKGAQKEKNPNNSRPIPPTILEVIDVLTKTLEGHHTHGQSKLSGLLKPWTKIHTSQVFPDVTTQVIWPNYNTSPT